MAANRSRLLVPLLAVLLLSSPTEASGPRPADLAARIDARLEARWKSLKVQPAPLAGDTEFLRRAYLDITGRIPRPADVHEFLADSSADKRGKLIDSLLDEPRFAVHFANVFRAELLPEA